MISKKYKFIIVRPPRTASKALLKTVKRMHKDVILPIPLEDWLIDTPNRKINKESTHYPNTHLPISQYKDLKNFEEYKIFGVIRDPWTRMSSYWHRFFKMSRGYRKFPHLKSYNPNPSNNSIVSFKEFIKALKTVEPKIRQQRKYFHGDLINYYFSIDGKLIVKNYIRFNNLKEDFKKVCEEVGLPKIKISRLEANYDIWGSTYDPKEVYTPELIDIVREKFKTEIEYFKYEF